MPIFPLPVFEADSDPARREGLTVEEQLALIEEPETMVVRFGRMAEIGEFKQAGGIRVGCGARLVARTHRGTEIVEMTTTTCRNSGCSKSVDREDMLEYIERSGGRNYPFHTNGRILRVESSEDASRDRELQAKVPEYRSICKRLIEEHRLEMELIDVEPILGEEVLTVYYLSEHRVDFRDLLRDLAEHFSTRIEMRQVGARDEARLVADYERCGQQCCCKNFLKSLPPVSMRSAKQQKQTLDPHKITGRCGRLMCCLRYEDQSYRELKKNLPHRKTRVGTPEGPGLVVDSKILVQLVLVELEHDHRTVAIPVEELSDPETCPRPWEEIPKEEPPKRTKRRRRRRGGGKDGDASQSPQSSGNDGNATKEGGKRRRRRRRKRGGGE